MSIYLRKIRELFKDYKNLLWKAIYVSKKVYLLMLDLRNTSVKEQMIKNKRSQLLELMQMSNYHI